MDVMKNRLQVKLSICCYFSKQEKYLQIKSIFGRIFQNQGHIFSEKR